MCFKVTIFHIFPRKFSEKSGIAFFSFPLFPFYFLPISLMSALKKKKKKLDFRNYVYIQSASVSHVM